MLVAIVPHNTVVVFTIEDCQKISFVPTTYLANYITAKNEEAVFFDSTSQAYMHGLCD